MLKKADKTNIKNKNSQVLKLSIGNHSFISRLTDSQDEFLHCHSFFEIILIRYGSIQHIIGNEKYVMNVGDACIVAPDTMHIFKRTGDCAHRDVMICDSLFKCTCDYLNVDLYDKLLTNGYYKFNISAQQIEKFEDAYYELIESNDENSFLINNKVLCSQLIGALYTDTKHSSDMSVFKSKCITIIDEEFPNRDVMNTLINELGYTQGHFCKKFKNTFQVTPVEYINRRRIISAGSTLILSNCSIDECCHMVGFDSVPHFIKLFKAHYGTTPTKYRRTYRLINSNNSK